jgi:hypothetical protein
MRFRNFALHQRRRRVFELFSDKKFRVLFGSNLLAGFGQGIAIIGVPWYLVRRYGDASVLSTIMIATGIGTLFFGTYAGALIDRYKRRSVLIVENLGAAVVVGAVALLGYLGEYSAVHVTVVYVLTIMVFNVHFPATYALAQESFPAEHYAKISGFLEVETQTAAIVSGGAAGLLLDSIGLRGVFVINMLTYLGAAIGLTMFKYTPVVGVRVSQPGLVVELREAWSYLRTRPRFVFENIAMLMPFVVLIASQLVQPVYVSGTLHAGPVVYSLMEGVYAVTAVSAGLWMRNVATRLGEQRANVVAFIMFIAALCWFTGIPGVPAALGGMLIIGWANAGIRVNRISYVLHVVPTQLIGRVNMFFGLSVGVLRIMMLIVLSAILHSFDPRFAYGFCAIILLVALGLFWGYRER